MQGDEYSGRLDGVPGRVLVALLLGLLMAAAAAPREARAAELPETAAPLARRESTPLCSPECELITAPTEAASGREYEGSAPGGGFSPQELRAAYGLPEQGGAGVTVAVVDDLGDPNAESDLAEYRSQFGLPPCTEANGCFHQVNEHGVAHRPTSTGSWVGEITLDLDMVSAGCPECDVLLVEGSGRAGRVEGIRSAVELGADVVTNSWNFGFEEDNPANSVACEEEVCISEAEERRYESSFDFPGVPIIFSGGDYGYGVRYPSASPYVIAVGGTRLRHEASGGREWSEEAWSNPAYGKDEKGRGTGGGCSVFAPKPAWQTDTGCPDRMANDIAADADPRSPVAAYSSADGWRAVGGTSAAAPFIAGVEGLSTGASRRAGAEAIWSGSVESLFDISGGSIGTCTPPATDAYWCSAAVGFDGPTGWGTPDGPFGLAGAPEGTTEPATMIGAHSATLRAQVDDDGAAGGTTCSFQVAAASDPSFAAPLQTLPCSPATVASRASVTAAASGLAARTGYLFRVEVSSSAGGPIFGGTKTFQTTPEPPGLAAEPAGPVTRTTAALRAKVDNEGAAAGTRCVFEVTEAEDVKFQSPFLSIPCEPDPVRGEELVRVEATATGLAVDTSYLWRITATNAGGATDSIVESVTTLPEPPSVVTGGASAGSTGAVLRGEVDDEGDEAGSSCDFQVALASDPGFSTPVTTVPCDPATVTGDRATAVDGTVASLSPSTSYLYRVQATNRAGTSDGSTRGLTTEAGSPPVTGPVGTPVIVPGPPDETEIRQARERQEAEQRAREATTATLPPAPPSNAFDIDRAAHRGSSIALTLDLPGPGTITVSGPGVDRRQVEAPAAGTFAVRVRLSGAAIRRAAHHPRSRLRLLVAFDPSGGSPATRNLTVPLGRPSGR